MEKERLGEKHPHIKQPKRINVCINQNDFMYSLKTCQLFEIHFWVSFT